MTRLRMIYTDILWSFLAGLHGHSSQSRVSFNVIGSALKLRQKQNQSYGTFWYPKIQTAWSNLGCWFWCNYMLYTFARSLNLIYAFCPPILGDEQHFGASTELSQVDEVQVVPFVRMIAIRRYDMMWQSLKEHVSHVGEDREALDENLRLRNEASMSYAPTWWASFDSVESDVKIRIGSKSIKGKYISLAISCQP